MCPFCLLRGAEDICYANMLETKPICQRPECKGEHIQWLLKAKVISPSGKEETAREEAVNLAMGTPEEYWLDMEVPEDCETFFVNVVYWEEEKNNQNEKETLKHGRECGRKVEAG
jgi:hypothetical protein